MLDDSSQRLAPRLVRELETILRRLRTENGTILLVEQNARLALAMADQVLVLNKGRSCSRGRRRSSAGASRS